MCDVADTGSEHFSGAGLERRGSATRHRETRDGRELQSDFGSYLRQSITGLTRRAAVRIERANVYKVLRTPCFGI